MSATPSLAGDCVRLRALTIDDAPALFAAHGDPEVHLYWSGSAHRDVEETARYIADTLAPPGAHVWAICDEDGALCGRIALFVQREGVGEVGLLLAKAAQGKGFASRALVLVERFGFETLKLHRIAADVDPDNAGSLRLFERNGYQREGLLRANWKTQLGLRDSVIMAKIDV